MSFQIRLLKSNRHFSYDNSQSLLNAVEKNGVYPEYQCREGFCGACRTKLKKGKVSYKNPPLAFLNSEEILLCCCKVESDLEIEL